MGILSLDLVLWQRFIRWVWDFIREDFIVQNVPFRCFCGTEVKSFFLGIASFGW